MYFFYLFLFFFVFCLTRSNLCQQGVPSIPSPLRIGRETTACGAGKVIAL